MSNEPKLAHLREEEKGHKDAFGILSAGQICTSAG